MKLLEKIQTKLIHTLNHLMLEPILKPNLEVVQIKKSSFNSFNLQNNSIPLGN